MNQGKDQQVNSASLGKSQDEITMDRKQLDLHKRYQIRSDYILRNIAGEYAIIPAGEDTLISNAIMLPNETATYLWKLFQKPCKIEDAIKKILVKYEVSEEHVRRAVCLFIDELMEYKICEEVD